VSALTGLTRLSYSGRGGSSSSTAIAAPEPPPGSAAAQAAVLIDPQPDPAASTSTDKLRLDARLLQTLVQLGQLQELEFVGDLTGLLPVGSVFSSSGGRSVSASLAPVCGAEVNGLSSGPFGILDGLWSSSTTAAGGGGEVPGARSSSGSGSLQVTYNGPSVLTLLTQLSRLSSLVLEQWTGAFTSIGEFG
jgi:hypothetical protein